MSLASIEAAIPHRPPMLMIDEVVQQTDEQIVCRKTFGGDEYFFVGHYPETPIVPGVMMCEACLQAGAVLLSQFCDPNDNKVPVATRINNVKFKKVLRPGATVDITVKLTDRVGDAFFMTGKVTHENKLATRLDFACTVAALD